MSLDSKQTFYLKTKKVGGGMAHEVGNKIGESSMGAGRSLCSSIILTMMEDHGPSILFGEFGR